jgi:AcrR family transcriptional regulator
MKSEVKHDPGRELERDPETEKQQRVLTAAKAVFLRYGFRRVTMQDIADEVGISRPALYLVFPNKEEVFKAAVLQLANESLALIRAGLPRLTSVRSRLAHAFELWTVYPFEIMLKSPDARDLVECGQGFAHDVIAKTSAQFEAILVEILAPLKASAKSIGLSTPQIAHLLATSVHGFKEPAASVEELRALIDGLLKLTLSALSGSPVPARK